MYQLNSSLTLPLDLVSLKPRLIMSTFLYLHVCTVTVAFTASVETPTRHKKLTKHQPKRVQPSCMRHTEDRCSVSSIRMQAI